MINLLQRFCKHNYIIKRILHGAVDTIYLMECEKCGKKGYIYTEEILYDWELVILEKWRKNELTEENLITILGRTIEN